MIQRKLNEPHLNARLRECHRIKFQFLDKFSEILKRNIHKNCGWFQCEKRSSDRLARKICIHQTRVWGRKTSDKEKNILYILNIFFSIFVQNYWIHIQSNESMLYAIDVIIFNKFIVVDWCVTLGQFCIAYSWSLLNWMYLRKSTDRSQLQQSSSKEKRNFFLALFREERKYNKRAHQILLEMESGTTESYQANCWFAARVTSINASFRVQRITFMTDIPIRAIH